MRKACIHSRVKRTRRAHFSEHDRQFARGCADGAGHRGQFAVDQFFAGLSRVRRCVTHQVFHATRQRVRAAMFLDETGLGQIHEIRAGAAQPVAGRAKRRRVAERGNVANDLIERTMVAKLKLLRIMSIAKLGVAAWIATTTGGNLRHSQIEGCAASVGVFPRGHDDAGVRHGQPENRDNFFEIRIRNGVRRTLAVSEPTAGSMRGTLIVCGPTPNFSSKW